MLLNSAVQIIFSFLSFEISEDILRNQKFINSLPKFNIFGPNWIILVFVLTTLLKVANSKSNIIMYGSMLPNLKGH